MDLRVSVRELAGWTVVTVAGEVDLSNADELQTQLVETLDHPGRNVVVDLTELAFIDSTGLNALVAGWRYAQRLGVAFRIAGPRPPVAKVLRITDLDRLLGVFPSVEAARSAEPEVPAPSKRGTPGQPRASGRDRCDATDSGEGAGRQTPST